MGWWPWGKRAPADPAAVARDLEAARALLEDDDVDGARGALEDALERHGGDGRVVIALADLLLDLDDEAGARALVDRHRAALRALTAEAGADACGLEAELASLAGEVEAALALIEAGLRHVPEDPSLVGQRGSALFNLGRFAEARADLERAYAALEHVDAGILYDLACLAEREGKERTAGELFARAESQAPDDYPRPVRISKKAFDAAVQEALDELPDEIRALVDDGLLIQTLDVPPDDVVREQQDPLLLGLYEGPHLGERPMVHQEDGGREDERLRMNRVSLYKKNIEKAAADMDEVREQIRVTLLHEIGHHLGYDEDGLDRIGLA